MQRIVCLAFVLAAAACAAAARADEKADMKALIDRAVKAAGGEEKLARLKAETFKGSGKFYGLGGAIDYTGEWAVVRPGKMRVRIETGPDGAKFTLTRVLNGDKLWTKLNDKTEAVTDKEQIAEAKESMYAGWVTTLVPLLRGKGFELSPLGEVKVGGKAAVGVRVSHKGHRDVNLYFDKDKGLLVKSETIVKDPMAGGKETTQETVYGDYKEVSGVQRAMKVVISRDGKKYIDSVVSEIELKEKLDDALFHEP